MIFKNAAPRDLISGTLQVTISNKGVSKVKSKLFRKNLESFSFKAAGCNQLKSETQGVGIGLHTAWTLAQKLGGTLRFENKPKVIRNLSLTQAVFNIQLTSE